jgi:hypothetical protein
MDVVFHPNRPGDSSRAGGVERGKNGILLPVRYERARLANVDNNRGFVHVSPFARGHDRPNDQDASGDDAACPHADIMPPRRVTSLAVAEMNSG